VDDDRSRRHRIIEETDTSDPSKERQSVRDRARARMEIDEGDIWTIIARVSEAVGIVWIKTDEVQKAIARMEAEDVLRRAHCGGTVEDLRAAREALLAATEEHRRDRAAIHEVARRMELISAAPVETPPPSTPEIVSQPATAYERVLQLLTGPDGKRTPWSVALLAVLWQLLEAMLRHGITLGDYIRQSP